MRSVSTVSDLHLLCSRSHAPRHMAAIHRAADESDIFILNGDTFDFRWSTLESNAASVKEAIRWLGELADRARDTEIHFILGNHDHLQRFMDALDDFSRERPNLHWHPYYLKLARSVFLHGDVAIRKMTAADLERYRSGWLHEEQRGKLVNRVYDVAFKAGVHKAITRYAFPTKVIVERIRHYLDDIGEGEGSDTELVFFGHTHVAVENYEYEGQRFYNAGAPMPGLDFNILSTEVAA